MEISRKIIVEGEEGTTIESLNIEEGRKVLTIAKNTLDKNDDDFFIKIEDKETGDSTACCLKINELEEIFKNNSSKVSHEKGFFFPIKFTAKVDDIITIKILRIKMEIGEICLEEHFAMLDETLKVIIDFCKEQL